MPSPSPEQILAQMNRPTQWEGWVPTLSRAGYRPWSDDPGPLSMEDVAYGLAHTYRYGGQASPAVTVAEHCVLVAHIIRCLWPGNPHLELAGLLHDSCEAVLHDIQSPLRRCVQVVLPSGEIISWNESDARVSQNIARYFGVTPEHLASPEVRAADVLAACYEKRDCPNLRADDWGLPPIPEEVTHLKVLGHPPGVARAMFLDESRVLGVSMP